VCVCVCVCVLLVKDFVLALNDSCKGKVCVCVCVCVCYSLRTLCSRCMMKREKERERDVPHSDVVLRQILSGGPDMYDQCVFGSLICTINVFLGLSYIRSMCFWVSFCKRVLLCRSL